MLSIFNVTKLRLGLSHCREHSFRHSFQKLSIHSALVVREIRENQGVEKLIMENQGKVFLLVKFIFTRNQNRDPSSPDYPDFPHFFNIEEFHHEIINMAIFRELSRYLIFGGLGDGGIVTATGLEPRTT